MRRPTDGAIAATGSMDDVSTIANNARIGSEATTMRTGMITPRPSEAAQVRRVQQMLDQGKPALIDSKGTRIALPAAIRAVLKSAVKGLEAGRSVNVITDDEAITTQRAADILGVSRPHLVKLLEAGELPFHKTGSHRRIHLRDLNAYAAQRNLARRKILKAMSREAYRAGLYGNTVAVTDGSDR
jgi:excisionase family DNA binding protein